MDEYIKREDAIDAVLDVYCDTPDIDLSCEKFEAAILKIPAADVVEVRHGRWKNEGMGDFRCSLCSYVASAAILNNYCPSCGALMDKEE